MVWGTMFFPTNWSSQFIHDARITIPDEDYGWSEAETFRFSDPRTGLVYSAKRDGTETQLGLTVQRATGARILEWANYLLTLVYVVERDVDGAPILGADGRPTLVLDVDGKPQLEPDSAAAEYEYARYVDTIDLFRQLTQTFEHPIAELPEP
jgi:hypothetical protein